MKKFVITRIEGVNVDNTNHERSVATASPHLPAYKKLRLRRLRSGKQIAHRRSMPLATAR
jgi:hypothetical protein